MYKDLIEKHSLNKFIREIDGVYFPLNPEWKKISISVSGGADSALLSYIICNSLVKMDLKMEIHIISNVRMWKTRPWQKYNSLDVYNWLVKRFPTLHFRRHENFISPEIEYGTIGPIIKDVYGQMKSGDQISTRSHVEYICATHNINAWFAGITKNPPEEFSGNGMSDRNVDKLVDLNSIMIEHEGVWACHPFKYVTKDWIVKQYIENDIMDLFNITRSCEGEFTQLTYKNYVPGQLVPLCEKCFWCHERNWAKKINGI